MWKTGCARLKMTVHASGSGIAQTLYVPAARGFPLTCTGVLNEMVVAVSAPGHHTLPQGTSLPNNSRPRATGQL